MYIPLALRPALPPPTTRAEHDDLLSTSPVAGLIHLVMPPWRAPSITGNILHRRDDSMQNQNVTIGVVVGVLLTAFLVCLGYLLHRYRGAIRFTPRSKKRRRRRHSARSGSSSKGSKSSSDSVPPPPPPPPPPPA
ncbi:hypothetical protein B0T19DRAFT_440825 [Cercophora scortea]|uniref:Uncharacterized protein n=1 Tax=Cercophora scortea TaxID=314031 RepID=A0AAE0IZG3_9PEZI|nr:hypothetical protein B0T19DRAFT_440825 [Cercophora scortea]